MTRLHFDVRVVRNLVPNITKETKKAVKDSIKTVAQDIARTASETAPHKTGDLEDSYAIDYSFSGDVMEATVEFSVMNGSFNYAIAMHEWTYNLGAGSLAKSGGTGMSGTSYAVGRKYLERVFNGETQAYTDYISRKIMDSLRGGM